MENDETNIGLAAWNFQLLETMKRQLKVSQNNANTVPIPFVRRQVANALDFLENYESLKQRTIVNQLAKHANICKAEADELEALPFWKVWKTWGRWRRIKLLWISYNVYSNAMAIVLTTLPSDISAIVPDLPAESEQQKESEQ